MNKIETSELILPKKPLVDKRKYYIRDYNKHIHVLFVEDEKANTNALSIVFQEGSVNSNSVGLPHFLEHTIFQGSKNAKEDFMTLVAESGGLTNAFTGKDKTLYCATFKDEKFDTVCDEFFKMFADPKLEKGDSSKEKNAVNREHNKNITNDGWRFQVVRNELLRENSQAFGIYGCGSLETLKEIKVEDMREFEQKYFTKPINIVVYSKSNRVDKVDKLIEPLATKLNVDSSYTPRPTNKKIYNRFYGNLYHIVTLREIRDLIIEFEIDSVYRSPTKNGYKIISMLIEHPETLGKTLQDLGLAYGVECSVEYNYDITSTWCVVVQLTQKGLEDYLKVACSVYGFIEKIKEELKKNRKDFEQLIESMKKIFRASFDYDEASDPYSTAEELAQKMIRNEENLKNTLMNEASVEIEYEELVAQAEQLNRKNSFIFVRSNSQIENKNYREEEYFKVKYITLGKFDDFKDENPIQLPEIKMIRDLLPENYECLQQGGEETVERLCKKTFLKTVTSLEIPKVQFSLKLYLDKTKFERGIPLEQLVKLQIFTQLILQYFSRTNFNEILSQQALDISVGIDGLQLKTECFSSQFDQLIEKALEVLVAVATGDFGYDNGGFKTHFDKNYGDTKEEMIITCRNAKEGSVISQLNTLFLNFISPHNYNIDSLINAYKNISDWKFDGIFKNATEIRSAFVGNISKDQAEKIHKKVIEKLAQIEPAENEIQKNDFAYKKAIRSTKDVLVQQKAFDAETDQNCIALAFGFGSKTISSCVPFKLMGDLLTNNFFQNLRTKQQLGYIVALRSLVVSNNLYWLMEIQSNKSGELLKEKIEGYVDELDRTVESEKTHLDEYVKNNLNGLQEPLKNLSSHMDEVWSEIENESYDFKYKSSLVKVLKRLESGETSLNLLTSEILKSLKIGTFIVHGKKDEFIEGENLHEFSAKEFEPVESETKIQARGKTLSIDTNEQKRS